MFLCKPCDPPFVALRRHLPHSARRLNRAGFWHRKSLPCWALPTGGGGCEADGRGQLSPWSLPIPDHILANISAGMKAMTWLPLKSRTLQVMI